MDIPGRELTLEEKIDRLLLLVSEMYDVLEKFKPLLEKYDRASQAGNVFAAHRAMKKGSKVS